MARSTAASRSSSEIRAHVPVNLLYADFLIGVSAKATPTTITVRAEANCRGNADVHPLSGALQALLENAAARSLARAKQSDGAAADLSRALETDPTVSEAATNLAVAQVHARRTTEPVTTLASAAKHDPTWVAWRLAAELDLASLAAAPPLAKVYGAPASYPSHRALDGKHAWWIPEPRRRYFDTGLSYSSNRPRISSTISNSLAGNQIGEM